MIMDYAHITIDQNSLSLLIGGIILTCGLVSLLTRKNKKTHTNTDLFRFSNKQALTIITIIIFAVFVKTTYLVNTIFPTSTDLGHHLYWVEKIIKDGSLPIYTNLEIIEQENGYSFSSPQKMPDFIIGEHIFLAVTAILTATPVISAFPSLLLFAINIYTMLMIFAVSRRLFSSHRHGAMIAIITMLLVGPLWAISGAQAKFVSGGVIGNILGNLIIPTIFYFFYRALTERDHTAFISTICISTMLAYTHHLSALIFGYSLIIGIIFFIFLQKNGIRGYGEIIALFKDPLTIIILIFLGTWLFIIDPPSYLAKDTIASSVGSPTKSTRIGIPFDQLMLMVGDARFVFGVIGLTIFACGAFLFRFRKNIFHTTYSDIHATVILLGWGSATILMTLMPHILHVNILSSRIATYTIFPLAILGAYAIVWIYTIALHKKTSALFIPHGIMLFFLFICITYIFTSGMRDNATSLNPAPQTNAALQTFHVGDYASKVFKKQISENDMWMLKDHNYITADTWLKIFFAHEYSFPLSRAYFARYESNPDRETCTLEMISTPHSDKALKCYTDLNVKAVLVSTEQDAGQFLSSPHYDRIYQNDSLSLFIANTHAK